jgi:hypothetical protein
MKASNVPHSSAALLHPITLIALALWAINDHVIKGWGPGVLTGKLSDVAGVMVSPTVLLGILEWCAPAPLRRHRRAVLAASCAAIGALLVGLELSRPVELAYQHVLGSAQFVARGMVAWLSGGVTPAYALVHTTPDVTDLLTLPALAVPWWLGRRGQGRDPQPGVTRRRIRCAGSVPPRPR